MQVYKYLLCILLVTLFLGCQKPPAEEPTRKIGDFHKNDNAIKFQEHVVRKGDSLYTISQMYKVSMVDIMIDNNLSRNQEVLAGRILKIRSSLDFKDIQVKDVDSKPSPAVSPIIKKSVSNTTPPSKNKTITGNVPYMLIPAGDGYQNTISGKTIKSFQTMNYGRPLEGVEIRSNSSQNVKAVHNGVVAFISENFSCYGRCVAIANSRNEISFIYGLDTIKVKVGDVVKKGSEVGSIATGNILGLKILRNGIFQDPSKLIPGIQ